MAAPIYGPFRNRQEKRAAQARKGAWSKVAK
jgi:hypothetical protein